MLTLPFWFSPSVSKTKLSPTQFVAVVEAGHVIPGIGYCECNDPENCPNLNPVVYRSDQPADVEADTAPGTDTALMDVFMILVRLLIL